jgi:oxalate decarboxylase/phosphoglucose isomerase-like protein (cupin superfamily)
LRGESTTASSPYKTAAGSASCRRVDGRLDVHHRRPVDCLQVGEGTMVFVPPGTEHAIRNAGVELLVYVSATSPPFAASIAGQTWQPRDSTSS